MMNPYEYIAVLNPTEKERKDGKKPKLLFESPRLVLGKDEDHAKMLAARELPDEAVSRLDDVVIYVRPFAE